MNIFLGYIKSKQIEDDDTKTDMWASKDDSLSKVAVIEPKRNSTGVKDQRSGNYFIFYGAPETGDYQ